MFVLETAQGHLASPRRRAKLCKKFTSRARLCQFRSRGAQKVRSAAVPEAESSTRSRVFGPRSRSFGFIRLARALQRAATKKKTQSEWSRVNPELAGVNAS